MNIQEVIEFGNKVELYFYDNLPKPVQKKNIEEFGLDKDDLFDFLGWKFINESEIQIMYLDGSVESENAFGSTLAIYSMDVKISDI